MSVRRNEVRKCEDLGKEARGTGGLRCVEDAAAAVYALDLRMNLIGMSRGSKREPHRHDTQICRRKRISQTHLSNAKILTGL